MKNPKVSVVMPAYNHEKFVGEAIESVLNQTYTDFEFIIINDGSTDKTDQVIRSYKDERIKYLTQDNQGAHNTLNKGIEISKGDYISIINSDDIYTPDRLSYLVETADSKGLYFIFTDLILIDQNGKQLDKAYMWVERLKSIYLNSGSLEETFLSSNVAMTTSNFFFLSKIVKEIGGFKNYRYAHDYDFILRVLKHYKNYFLYVTEKKLLSYRLHNTNTIRESLTDVHIETLRLLLRMMPEFIQNEEDRLRVEASLKYMENISESLIQEIKSTNEKIDNPQNKMSRKIARPLVWFYSKYLGIVNSEEKN